MNDENQRFGQQISVISRDVAEMKDQMKALVQAMTRLALAEERIGQVNGALDRAFRRIDELEKEVQSGKLAQATSARTSAWVDRGIWAAASAAVVFAAKKVGLL